MTEPTHSFSTPPDDLFDPWRHLALLWRRRWVIGFAVLLSIGLGILWLRRQEPVYAATATLKFNRAPNTNAAGLPDDTVQFSYDVFRTQIEQIKSPAVAQAVVDSLDLDTSLTLETHPERDSLLSTLQRWVGDCTSTLGQYLVTYEDKGLDPETQARQRSWQRLSRSLTVSQRGDSLLVDVTFRSNNRNLAARVADEFCLQYIALTGEGRSDLFSSTQQALATKLDDARLQLKKAEQALFEYQKKVNLQVMDSSIKLLQTQIEAVSAEIENTKKQIVLDETVLAQWERGGPQLTDAASDRSVSALEDARTQLRLKEFELAATNTEDNPELKKVRLNIEALDREISANLERLKQEQVGMLEVERKRLAEFKAALAEKEKSVADIQALLIPSRELERETVKAREIYETLLQRTKQMDVSGGLSPETLMLLNRATVPEFADSPKKTRTMLVFVALGLFLGIGSVYGAEAMDRTVKSPTEVESRYQLPSLGLIPALGGEGAIFSRRAAPRLLLVARDQPQSPEAEAFRYVRTALQYSSTGGVPSVLLVTSCLPGEGKSTAALNLAITTAARGQRTLIIDGDLKKPSLHRALSLDRAPGLSDVLTQNAPLAKCLLRSVAENLDFIPAGVASPAPVDLLDSPALASLLESLRKEYEVIIIDSAPLEGMADSFVLAKKVDGLCLVVRHASTRRDVLHKVLTNLHGMRVRVLGVLYNCPVRDNSLAAYGYGYGYAYAYGQPATPAASKSEPTT